MDMRTPSTWERELYHYQKGNTLIAGLDEVGRGAWAGPIVAAAYIFYRVPQGVRVYDSKLMSESQRLRLAAELQHLGAWGIGQADSDEIDKVGLQPAQYLAYKRALAALPFQPDILLLDAHHERLWLQKRYD